MSGKSIQKKNTTRANKWKQNSHLFPHILLLAIICVVFAYNYKSVFDPKLDINGDNINYFLLAKALTEGDGYVDMFSPNLTPHTHFPPGYPIFMSLFMRVFPDNVLAMKILNGLLFLLATLLLFRIVRKTTENNIWIAFATCLLVVMHSELLRWSVIMMSEMLYIVISFGIILLCLDLEVGKIFTKGKKDPWQICRLVILCLLVVFSYLVRTMGISVVLAASLAFAVTALKTLLKKDKTWMRQAAVVVLIMISLFGAHCGWSLRNNRVSPGYKSDYSATFLYTKDKERMTPALWKERLQSNLSVYVGCWIPNSLVNPYNVIDFGKEPKPTTKTTVAGIVLILLMAFGIAHLKKGKVLILSYILITFAVLMLYQEQYSGVRYFVPIIPLIIFSSVNGLWSLFSTLSFAVLKKKIVAPPCVALALAIVLLVPPYCKGREHYIRFAKYDTYQEMNPDAGFTHYIQAAEWLKKNVGHEAVIACRKPEVMYMYSGYRHAVRFPLRGDEESVIRFFRDSGANCVVLDTWSSHAYSTIFPVMKKVPNAFPVVHIIEQGKDIAPTVVAAVLRSKLPDIGTSN